MPASQHYIAIESASGKPASGSEPASIAQPAGASQHYTAIKPASQHRRAIARLGRVAIQPDMMLGNSTAPTITAIVDQVHVTSGSWTAGDATGTLILKKYTSTSFFGSTSNLYLGSQIALTGNGVSTRGFRGVQAQTWQSNDVLEPASDLDLGVNLPVSGYFLDPANENTAPEGVTFGHYPSQEECLIVESLMGGESVGIWLRQTILDGTQARENIEGDISFAYF